MKKMLYWTKGLALAGVTLIALAGCSGGGPGGQGVTPGPETGTAVDGFTSAVVTIAKASPEDSVPADIEAIAVVLVDDQPAAKLD